MVVESGILPSADEYELRQHSVFVGQGDYVDLVRWVADLLIHGDKERFYARKEQGSWANAPMQA